MESFVSSAREPQGGSTASQGPTLSFQTSVPDKNSKQLEDGQMKSEVSELLTLLLSIAVSLGKPK